MQGKYKNKAYPLRIEETTLNAIKSIATEEGRTANKQIERILQEYVDNRTKVNQIKPSILKANAHTEIQHVLVTPGPTKPSVKLTKIKPSIYKGL